MNNPNISFSEEYGFDLADLDLNSIINREINNEKIREKELKNREAELKIQELEIKVAKKQEKIKENIVPEKKKDEDDAVKHQQKICHIRLYLEHFPEKLKEFSKINLEKKTYEELEDISTRIEVNLSTTENIKMGVGAFRVGIRGTEELLTAFTPINCAGLSKMCDDPEVIDMVKHIILKNTTMVNISPENRLMFRIIMNITTLHTINTALGNRSPDIDNIDQTPDKTPAFEKELDIDDIADRYVNI